MSVTVLGRANSAGGDIDVAFTAGGGTITKVSDDGRICITVVAEEGSDVFFSISPNLGFNTKLMVDDVKTPTPLNSTYAFENVTSDHRFGVMFGRPKHKHVVQANGDTKVERLAYNAETQTHYYKPYLIK